MPIHLEQAEKEVTSETALREISVARRVIEVLRDEIVKSDVGYSKAALLLEGNVKKCPKCKVTWPRTKAYFQRDCWRKDGLNSWCKRCCAKWKKAKKQKLRKAS